MTDYYNNTDCLAGLRTFSAVTNASAFKRTNTLDFVTRQQFEMQRKHRTAIETANEVDKNKKKLHQSTFQSNNNSGHLALMLLEPGFQMFVALSITIRQKKKHNP